MAKWIVETRVTVRNVYHVDAENAKEAEEKSVDAQPVYSEDENEETMSIVRAPADAT